MLVEGSRVGDNGILYPQAVLFPVKGGRLPLLLGVLVMLVVVEERMGEREREKKGGETVDQAGGYFGPRRGRLRRFSTTQGPGWPGKRGAGTVEAR